jgi:hypothetical protein
MRIDMKQCVLAVAGALVLVGDYRPDAPLGFTLGREAAALIGAPFTPLSAAGVARRTTRRVVAVEATTASAAAAGAVQQQQQQQQAMAKQQAATAQQQQAVAQQQAATAQQQQAVAQQQATTARQQAAAAGGAPAVGTIVAALPAGCTGTAKGGVEYYQCGSVYYRAAFQGNNLIYVVQQP